MKTITFKHDNQPYGMVEFEVEKLEPVMAPDERRVGNDWLFRRAEAGWIELHGTVTKGSVTSRLFHATSTQDLKGRPYSLQVPPEALDKGIYVTVAM